MPNELTVLDGHEGPPLCPPINPLAVATGELEERLLGPSRRIRYQASNRRCRGSHGEPGPTRSSGERRRSDAPHWKAVHPEPEPKTIELPASRLKKERLSIATTSCLSGEGVSRHPRGTGVRPVSKAQDAYDSCGEDHAASNAPGGSQVQAKPKAQQEINEETENGIIISELDRKWCDFRHRVRGSGSRAKQRRNGSIEAIPRRAPQVFSLDHWKPSGDDGRHPGSTGRSMAAGDKITTRRSFAVSTSAEMRVLAEIMDSLMAGHVGRAGDIMAQRFRALEYVATEGRSWSKTKHLELAPLDGASSLTPGLRGDMNRQARRDQRWIGRPSNWTSREQDQNPSRQGAKGSAKNGTQWKSREGNQFGKGNKKENKTWESNEHSSGRTRKDPNECGGLL